MYIQVGNSYNRQEKKYNLIQFNDENFLDRPKNVLFPHKSIQEITGNGSA